MKKEKASSTAFTVAQGMLYTGERFNEPELLSEETIKAYKDILASSEEGRKRISRLKNPFIRFLIPAIESLMMPGITLHYALRKKYIEAYVEKKLSSKTKQVVNLGAGFDTLAYRLHKKNRSVNFIEIDHPATSAVKKDFVEQDSESYDNLHLLPVDFTTQTLEGTLGESPFFDGKLNTVYVIEGVLMYLTEEQVQDLFASLKKMTSGKFSVVFTFAEAFDRSPDSYGLLLKFFLIFKSEPLKWLIDRKDLPDFINGLSYSFDKIGLPREFRKEYMKVEYKGRLHEGEFLASADSNGK